MKQTALLLSAILFALGVSAITRAQDDAAAPVPATKFLICDFAYIVENCDEAIDIQEKFQKERQAAETKLKAEQQRLQLKIKEIQEKKKLSERDDKVYEALKKAIDSTDQRDINSSCMIAMAKIGQNHPEFKLKDVFTPRLAKGDQEIRETAALAMGIAAIDPGILGIEGKSRGEVLSATKAAYGLKAGSHRRDALLG